MSLFFPPNFQYIDFQYPSESESSSEPLLNESCEGVLYKVINEKSQKFKGYLFVSMDHLKASTFTLTEKVKDAFDSCEKIISKHEFLMDWLCFQGESPLSYYLKGKGWTLEQI